MKRILAHRWTVVCLMTITLLLAACGGSSEEPTATTVPATEPIAAATSTSEPTATLEPSPSPTYTPEPTATPRPAIITSTPRPIATRPPVEPTQSTEPVPTDQLAIDFTDGAGPFPTGTADDGSSLEVTDGVYVVSMPEGYWMNPQPSAPELVLRNGTVSVDVAFAGGEGFAGVLGRHALDADGNEAFLVCGIYTDGSAGCYEFAGGAANETLFVESGAFEMRQFNTLTLTIVDGWYAFDVNQRMLGEGQISHEVDGNWGLYVQSMAGTVAAGFDWFTVRNPTVASTTFDSGSPGPFWTGTLDDAGSAVEVVEGALAITMTGANQWYFVAPTPAVPFNDGLVETVTSVEGSGATGVIARASIDENGLNSGYICEINDSGAADCYVVVANEWTYLFGSEEGVYDPTGANLMTMRITGTQIDLSINSQHVGSVDDSTLTTGEWGMYSLFDGDPTSRLVNRYDSILIMDTSVY